MKKFFENLGLIENDEKPASTVKAPLRPTINVEAVPDSSIPIVHVPQSAPDERATKVLMDKVNKSTIQGYPDFITMNDDLKTDIPDPIVRARTVIKTITRMKSVTGQSILESVEDRRKLLGEASQHVQASITSLMSSELSRRDTELASIEAEREKLEKAFTELRVREETLRTERKNTEAELKLKQKQIATAAQALETQFTRDRDIIASTLN